MSPSLHPLQPMPAELNQFEIQAFQGFGVPFDARECLEEALARELDRRFGGNAVLNRLEASALLERLLQTPVVTTRDSASRHA